VATAAATATKPLKGFSRESPFGLSANRIEFPVIKGRITCTAQTVISTSFLDRCPNRRGQKTSPSEKPGCQRVLWRAFEAALNIRNAGTDLRLRDNPNDEL